MSSGERHDAEAGGEAPSPGGAGESVRPYLHTLTSVVRDYFGERPAFGVVIVPMCLLSMALFTRHPTKTNFIFDEQEALLANPYVRSVASPEPKFGWLAAFTRDFWGLGPERSIGSYRPLPNLVWRALWALGAREQSPFLHHWVNVLIHGLNGALLTLFVHRVLRSPRHAYLAGALFTGCALLTEAVSGVVGLADVLSATGALLALLTLALPLGWMIPALFVATCLALYSKESALSCVPAVPLTALFVAHQLHERAPRRWLRASVAFAVSMGAFVLYVESRRRLFPAPIPHEIAADAVAGKPLASRAFAAVLRWYAQPTLPRDPLNNPLARADVAHRVAGALRVYASGLLQVVFPHPLSGDYSFPQEPVPDTLTSTRTIVGGVLLAAPLPVAWLAAWRSWRKAPRVATLPIDDAPVLPVARPLTPLLAAAAAWVVLFYFPVSNIPVVLPTVRAERFWYFPVIGTSILIAALFAELHRVLAARRVGGLATALAAAFLLMHGGFARAHANDYTDDLAFWDSTRKAVPRSAKAHLNYSVMKGARGDLPQRLASNEEALRLAPEWAMASVYLADTLCRMHRASEAWPHYQKGFRLAPNDSSLIALGLQCLWDEKQLQAEDSPIRRDLEAMKGEHPGSWLEYLARDILDNGEEHGGVEKKHRPRGYNEGPKE